MVRPAAHQKHSEVYGSYLNKQEISDIVERLNDKKTVEIHLAYGFTREHSKNTNNKRKFDTTILYSIFFKNSSFFSQNRFFCR